MHRWLVVALSVALTAGVAIAIATRQNIFFLVADATEYVAMASGRGSQVPQPFAFRQLGTLVVHWLAQWLHWSVERAFFLEGTVAILFVLAVCFWLMVRRGAPRWLLAAVVILPFWTDLYRGLALPDLWYAALFCALLLLLERGWFAAAALMMLPLMVSRESTSLTLVCFLLAGYRRMRWQPALLAVVAAGVGNAVVKRLTLHSGSNLEHLPVAFYMLAKVPWNFCINVLGIVPWSNLYPLLCSTPRWMVQVHLGPLHGVGVCSIQSDGQRNSLHALLLTFGLLPLLAAFLWSHRTRGARQSVMLRFCLIYGAFCFVLAPVLGTAVDRLFGYSWPLFLIALPMLFAEVRGEALTGRGSVPQMVFLALHGLTCAIMLCDEIWVNAIPQGPTLVLGLGLYVAGYFALRRWFASADRDVAMETSASLPR